MKENILFVIDSLECAGAEKSLVTLLSLLDFEKYSVDLFLFGHGGELEELVPPEVNLLDPAAYSIYSKLPMNIALFNTFINSEYRNLCSRLEFTLKLRTGKYRNSQKARIFWQSTSRAFKQNKKEYDIAISYAQGVPTFYVAEKIRAKKKFAWVNVSYRLDEKEQAFQKQYYDVYDRIVAVSDSTKEVFLEAFPNYKNKMNVIYDINNPEFINRMAKIGTGYEDGFDGVRILTIGRLANQKGYDIALDACKQLKESGLHFRWYALGKGPLQQEIEHKIKEYGLSDHFILLGVKSNPYPYIANADLYVQTSRFEGFGLAIAEARMLNIPVVTTEFDAVYNQMVQRKNGLVTGMDGESVAEGINELLNNRALYKKIVEYLKKEKKGNIEELDKFYQLIEGQEVDNSEEKESAVYAH
ncbi:glycosyltransferase [Alteribacter natronophilus]|uniref:glycosyltransferase n=1 Tax=Alteribacter natronophilus TaxID=2583810 RepID=UPI00110D4D6C|nr:glycosyltransferase [Alteribacter natronophilus]TMW70542.1 glycosyltransferase [Alteribacter natronophilus]